MSTRREPERGTEGGLESALKPSRLELMPRVRWVLPAVALAAASIALFWGFYSLDYYVLRVDASEPPAGPVGYFLGFEAEQIADAVGALAGILASVLGIIVTVVSIVVQLASARYGQVARMFLRDRVNLGVVAYYIVACIYGLWLSVALRGAFVPTAALVLMLLATTAGLVLMPPYFRYVFDFVEPMNIIRRIRDDMVQTVARSFGGATESDLAAVQRRVVSAMEELGDIAYSSVSRKDKLIAGGAVDALRDFALHHIGNKRGAPQAWFVVADALRRNPDVVALAPQSLRELETDRVWVEWKALRQYLGLYNDALQGATDINYLIAINTRYVGEAAVRVGDEAALSLVIRFMNSYMRSALNARDVRTAYNVLNQYRLLLEYLVRRGAVQPAVRGISHLNYYGRTAFDLSLSFVTETVAYDMATLCQLAHDVQSDCEVPFLDALLELDQPLRSRAQEAGLLGVRKAQIKLGAYYLSRGDAARAERIAADMAHEPTARLEQIRTTLERVEHETFWEITDRGTNFEYLPPEQRSQLSRFFKLLTAPPRAD